MITLLIGGKFARNSFAMLNAALFEVLVELGIIAWLLLKVL